MQLGREREVRDALLPAGQFQRAVAVGGPFLAQRRDQLPLVPLADLGAEPVGADLSDRAEDVDVRLAQAVAGGRRVDREIRAHAALDQALADEVAHQIEVLRVAQLPRQHGQDLAPDPAVDPGLRRLGRVPQGLPVAEGFRARRAAARSRSRPPPCRGNRARRRPVRPRADAGEVGGGGDGRASVLVLHQPRPAAVGGPGDHAGALLGAGNHLHLEAVERHGRLQLMGLRIIEPDEWRERWRGKRSYANLPVCDRGSSPARDCLRVLPRQPAAPVLRCAAPPAG